MNTLDEQKNVTVAVFRTHGDAETAAKELQHAGAALDVNGGELPLFGAPVRGELATILRQVGSFGVLHDAAGSSARR